MISSTEAGASAFTPVSVPKSPTSEVDNDRDDFHWRNRNSSLPFSRHFWSVWGPYSPTFSPAAMDHVLKPSSPPLWPVCSFGAPAYPSLWKERFHQFRFASSSDEEKPSQSYIGLIAEAILSSPEEKLILSDIYNYILTHYPYFRNKGTGWRNSIRHNLSLNDCFVKAGRSPNGKGHFWAISSLYYDDFRRGDFRRRRIQKRSHKSRRASNESKEEVVICKAESSEEVEKVSEDQDELTVDCSTTECDADQKDEEATTTTDKPEGFYQEKRKSFDMASLLAPDRGQREAGLLMPVYPRAFEPSLVYNSYATHSGEYLPSSPAFDRFHVSEPTRLIFPYNYRLAC